MHGWEQWREWAVSRRDRKTITDDTIIDVKAPQGDELQFGVDAMYLLLNLRMTRMRCVAVSPV